MTAEYDFTGKQGAFTIFADAWRPFGSGYAIKYVYANTCVDNDADGHYTNSSTCPVGDDCNDNDPTVYPGAPELCDGKDNNCNGQVDEGCEICLDNDNDGHNAISLSCAGSNDCNDNEPTVYPGAPELCDGKDNNCNGQVDEGCECSDGATKACYTGPSGTLDIGLCKGATQTCSNGRWGACTGELLPAEEICDGKNNDCDKETDENCPQCPVSTNTNSSTSLSTGNYHHTQDVFNNVTLIYDSRRTDDGVIGKGWTHSYDIRIVKDTDGSLELTEDGTAVNFRLSGGIYKAEPRSGITAELAVNPDNTYTLTKQDSTVFQFDAQGRLLSITDRNNNQTVLAYTNSLLSSATDPYDRIMQFAYDASNRISGITDPAGRNTTLSYNPLGLLSAVINPDGNGWGYVYDTAGRLISMTDPVGATTQALYDSNGRMTQATDAEGNVKTISYDHANSMSRVTEWDGGVWTYKYDDFLNVQTEITDPTGAVKQKVYNSSKNLLSDTDESGRTTSYTYDADGNMLTSTDPQGNSTGYTYNSFGQMTAVTVADGKTTTYGYDAKGNLLSVTDPAGAVSSYTYDARGQLLTDTDPEGRTTSYIHDAYGNISAVTLSDGSAYSFIYDISGNLLSQTDSTGNTTTYEYDIMGNLMRVTDPSGNASSFTYDAKGNRKSVTDANGNTTYYEYDFKGRMIKVIDSLGNATTYSYGGTGCASCGGGTDKLSSITDAGGNTTSYEYDLLGRLTKETDPEGNIITY